MKKNALPDVVLAPRTDPIYMAHGYLTKVPVSAIQPFIEAYSKPGEVVLDPFAGSGMTGIAAVMAGRKAELSDLSVLGRHIGTGYLTTVDGDELESVGHEVIATARAHVGDLYQTVRAADGQRLDWVRTIWSFVYECPQCEQSLCFYTVVNQSGLPKPSACEHCGEQFVKRNWPQVDDVPVAVVVRGTSGKQEEQSVAEFDHSNIRSAGEDPRLPDVPSLAISPEREMYRRSALGKWGLTETGRFFTARNAIALLEITRAIDQVKNPALKKKLRFAFTAILPRASRRYQWSAKRPLNAQNQTYYISPVHYEWNVFELFARKVRAARRAQDFAAQQSADGADNKAFRYTVASAAALRHVADASIDYVFTDPPFGSNIFYSDMNLFQEAWLGEVTQHEHEAVIHTGGKQRAKAAEKYEALMTEAFCEAYRVLKPGRHMSIVFGNSRGNVWSMVQRAVRESGFEPVPAHLALLDKGQRSVKGLTSGREEVVTVDLVLTVRKPKRPRRSGQQVLPLEMNRLALVTSAIASLEVDKARNPSYVYVATIKEAIRQRMPVDNLHLSDVLHALGAAGYTIDSKSGLLNAPACHELLVL